MTVKLSYNGSTETREMFEFELRHYQEMAKKVNDFKVEVIE
jgi:hypothetical protein